VTPTPHRVGRPEWPDHETDGAIAPTTSEAFKKGNEKGVLDPHSSEDLTDLGLAIAGHKLTQLTGTPVNLGIFKVSNIDEARDQWSHKFSRPEQRDLLRKAAQARFVNREGNGRELIFLSGDIHVGCIFDIKTSQPDYNIVSLTSSGISAKQEVKADLFVGSFVDEDFKVAPEIRSTLREIIPILTSASFKSCPPAMARRSMPSSRMKEIHSRLGSIFPS
jgi:hypothetical protein